MSGKIKKIALIGSTGSIGTQVTSVVRRNPDKFSIVSISAGSNAGLFLRQVDEFRPRIATIATELNKEYTAPKGVEVISGSENAFLSAIIEDADIVVVALVGFLGIKAVLRAIELKKDVALANKESLVVGGELVMKKAKEAGITITPIDSEHSAIWQALDFDFKKPYKRLILTSSGGALRDYSTEQLRTAKVKDALSHPTWNMGAKITVDCATLVNKAFEVAEAHHLFGADYENIDVIIHRESIIHSMVEFKDGSTIAQMSYPNMELPIQIALSYPNRYESGLKSLDFAKIGKLTFGSVDNERFPCFSLVLEAEKKGGLYPAVVNGANERAVKAFLSGDIFYFDIHKILSGALSAFKGNGEVTVESLTAADKFGESFAERYLIRNV